MNVVVLYRKTNSQPTFSIFRRRVLWYIFSVSMRRFWCIQIMRLARNIWSHLKYITTRYETQKHKAGNKVQLWLQRSPPFWATTWQLLLRRNIIYLRNDKKNGRAPESLLESLIRANGRNDSQQFWELLANNVASVWTGLKVWPVSNFVQQRATGCANGRNM